MVARAVQFVLARAALGGETRGQQAGPERSATAAAAGFNAGFDARCSAKAQRVSSQRTRRDDARADRADGAEPCRRHCRATCATRGRPKVRRSCLARSRCANRPGISDMRWTLNRMTAHLAIAEALRSRTVAEHRRRARGGDAQHPDAASGPRARAARASRRAQAVRIARRVAACAAGARDTGLARHHVDAVDDSTEERNWSICGRGVRRWCGRKGSTRPSRCRWSAPMRCGSWARRGSASRTDT